MHDFSGEQTTASYQHEGDITNINDWDFFTRSQPIRDRVAYMTTFLPTTLLYNGPRIELQPARDAVKFWDPAYYEKDFDNAKSLGLNAFRIGIEWSRIEPQKGVWDYNALSHYKQMIMSMTQKGLTPVVTLNHFTLPLWVLTPPTTIGITGGEPVPSDPYWQSLRGWENVQTIDEFIKYVSVVVNALNGQVDYWLTLNEPVSSYTGLGYVAGIWSPGFIGDGNRAKLALHNQIEAHVRAYDTIKALDNVDADGDGIPAIVGFAHFMFSVVPSQSGIWRDIWRQFSGSN